ncbi:hypothetical protein IRB79_27300 (plasmid) [Cytobacillus oceanisediminis]|nr:hypothetical protein IRB79_27300 [Cytobacillus oceanisediminis]
MVQILLEKEIGGLNMLKFINKKGQKVMELADSGDVKILNEDLEKSFEKSPKEKTKKKENEKND